MRLDVRSTRLPLTLDSIPTPGYDCGETLVLSGACPLSEARAPARAFVFPESPVPVTYFAYLDEFGHIGPYVRREHPIHNDSPVFGLAGFVLPSEHLRGFGTWFFQHHHDPNRLYDHILREAIKRIDDFCGLDCQPTSQFVLVLDEHSRRSALITAALRSMFARRDRRRCLIEPPFHVQSHRYQTLQAADWIAGLVGRLGAAWAEPAAYPENEVFRRYFEHRLNRVSRRSGVRT